MKRFYQVEGSYTEGKNRWTHTQCVFAESASRACCIAIKLLRSEHPNLPFTEKYRVIG